MKCNVCIRVCILTYICVCVQSLDSLHDICMWSLDSFDGIHTLKGAVPLLAWQAKSAGGNGFIGASGFFGWDFYTRDGSTGLTRFHRLPNACSLFATCGTLVFCCLRFSCTMPDQVHQRSKSTKMIPAYLQISACASFLPFSAR